MPLIVLLGALCAALSNAQEPSTDAAPTLFGGVFAAENGAPLSGARVEAYASRRRGARTEAASAPTSGADGAPVATAATDANGAYALSLPPGVWFVRAILPGRATAFAQAETPRDAAFDFTLARGVELRGKVVDPDGKPLAGAVVSSQLRTTTTDAEGAFALPDLAADEETPTVLVRAAGFGATEVSPEWPPTEPLVVTPSPSHAVDVLVSDAAGEPVGGARLVVRLAHAAPFSEIERLDFEGTTGDGGAARFEGLPPGRPLVVHALKDGFVVATSEVVLPRDARRRDLRQVRLTLGAGAKLDLRVLDDAGRPVPGAAVSVRRLVEWRQDFRGAMPPEGPSTAVETETATNAEGLAALAGLPAELVVVEVRAKSFATRALALNAAEAAAPMEIRLLPDASPPAPRIPWRASLAAAFDEAAAKRVPVLIAVGMDDEVSNDTLRTRHFRDPEVVRAFAACAPLVASAYGPPNPSEAHVEQDGVCGQYGSCSCAAHQAIEAYVVAEFFGGARSFTVPRHLALSADGIVLEHRPYFLSESALRRFAVRALRRTSPAAAAVQAGSRYPDLAAALHGLSADAARRTLATLANGGDEDAVALLFAHGGATAAVDAGLLREAVAAFPPQEAAKVEPTREQLMETAAGAGWKAAAALRALRRAAGDDVGSDEELFELYLSRVRDDDDLVREEAVAGLAASASTAVDVLRGALGDPVTEIRIVAALGLVTRGEDSGREVLETAREHVEYGERVRAALK
jgi:hypothetical protein